MVCPEPEAVAVALLFCVLSTIHEFACVVVTEMLVLVCNTHVTGVPLAPIGDAAVPVREMEKALTPLWFAVHTTLFAPVAGAARISMSIHVF